MTAQEILHEAYNELADKGNWESTNYKLILIKNGMKIVSKDGTKEVILKTN